MYACSPQTAGGGENHEASQKEGGGERRRPAEGTRPKPKDAPAKAQGSGERRQAAKKPAAKKDRG